MMNPNPTCQNDNCRFHPGMSMTTCAYYPPVYDKHGNNINPDRNLTSGSIKCSTCNKEWTYHTQLGETTYTETQNGI